MTRRLTRVPLGTQHYDVKEEDGDDEEWMYVLDPFHPPAGPDQIPLLNRTTKTFGGRAKEPTANQKLRFLYPSDFYVFLYEEKSLKCCKCSRGNVRDDRSEPRRFPALDLSAELRV